jgi:hypothetical protein
MTPMGSHFPITVGTYRPCISVVYMSANANSFALEKNHEVFIEKNSKKNGEKLDFFES